MTEANDFVRAVEAHMRAAIASTPIAAPASRLLDAGGKRLRARLLWWAAAACGGASHGPGLDRLVRAGSAIELAHLGSLVHDDIVDGAETRRGVATVHRSHGTRAATDAGAAIAHLASELAAGLGARARRSVRRALLATCRGQIRELALPFLTIPPRTRLAVMQEKTGAFFQLAADLGAILADADGRSRAAVGRFARRFGVAFQIADDVLDLTGDPAALGRANGADLRDGVLTLPVLLADDPHRRIPPLLERIRITGESECIADCVALVIAGRGVAAAGAVASWWLCRAVDATADLPRREASAELIHLARASIERGLRVGRPTFVTAGRTAPRPFATSPITVAVPRADVADVLPARSMHVLEWFHPGLAASVATRAGGVTVAAHRGRLRARLCMDREWSRDARLAADAIALAHALADERSLDRDPVRTLAFVDALHCAAIGFLGSASSSDEHAAMAVRARRLVETPESYEPACLFRRPYAQSTMHISA